MRSCAKHRGCTNLGRTVLARLTRPRCLALALIGCCAARAQTASAQTEPEAETVTVEDVLHPRAGRAPLELSAEPASPIAIGLATDAPARVDLSPRFGAERDPVRCRAPCSLYLRPGLHRVSFDADTPYPWSADFALSAQGDRFVIRPHRVGFSALGGAMFVLGCAGSLLGPGVIIVNLVVGDPAQLPWAILGGSVATAVGVGLLVGGWFTVREGAPRVTRRAALRAWLGPTGVYGVF